MKSNSISVIRCLAMCMIVSCHFMQGLDNELAVWLNIGVQIFLCMSGYLYGRKNIESVMQWYVKQYIKIMKPMWILLTVLIAVKLIGKFGDVSLIAAGLSYLGVAGFGTIPELSHTWFITYILLCYLITPLLQQIDVAEGNKTICSVFKLMMVIGVLEVLYLSRLINFLPQYVACYIVGYYMSRREEKSGDIYERNRLVAIFCILAIVTLPFRLFLQYGSLSIKGEMMEYLVNHIIEWHHSLLGVAIFFCMLIIFDKCKVQRSKFIRFFEKHSYCIYLVHQIFIMNTFSLLSVTDCFVLNICMILLVIVISAVLLEWMQRRIGRKSYEKK